MEVLSAVVYFDLLSLRRRFMVNFFIITTYHVTKPVERSLALTHESQNSSFWFSDCSMTGNPDMTPLHGSRNLPTWNLNSDLEDETLVKAFETYKKKDSSKGS